MNYSFPFSLIEKKIEWFCETYIHQLLADYLLKQLTNLEKTEFK